MDWGNERYVRLYTRDTVDWCLWPWQARALFPLLLRKMDRKGNLPIGQHGSAGIAELVRLPIDVVQAGLDALTRDGCVTLRDGTVTLKNYVPAQEAKATDALRAKNHRDRVKASEIVTPRDGSVTKRDVGVTDRHAPSQTVTPSLAEPSLLKAFPASQAQKAATPKKPTDPRHAPFIDAWCRLWLRLRGGKYLVQPKDARAVKQLLQADPAVTPGEAELRINRAFEDDWFRAHGDLQMFCSRWSTFMPLRRNSEAFENSKRGDGTLMDPYPENPL